MVILSASQIRAWDAYTLALESIPSINLMERACVAFVNWFAPRFEEYKLDGSGFDVHKEIGVVCGTGNNGGDGLGIARLLFERKFKVKVWLIAGKTQSQDFKLNLVKLPKEVDVVEVKEIASFNPSSVWLIDALFGSGLSRPVDGIYSQVIKRMNQCRVVSVDVPSGLQIDKPSTGDIVRANHTITFGAIKLPFMFPEYGSNVGEWHLVDIGLSPEYLSNPNVEREYSYITSIADLLHGSYKFAHKGMRGHALLVAGSLGKMGAGVLASRAALRSGVGLLTVHVPKIGYQIIQTSVPEAMASVDKDEENFSHVPDATKFDAIGVGPGLGITQSTIAGLRKLMEPGKPMVLDADALTIIGENRDMIKKIPPGSILTPHPGEFRRLVGDWTDDFHRLKLQQELSFEGKCVVVLKGAHSSITSPDGKHVWFNSTGNAGMAKGGSGDVLTGVLTSLLAQKYSSTEAAIIGVFGHGRAGDLAAAKIGQNGLMASDIVEFLGQSFRR
ncbi:MAG TPA: NAD(P)H-hydrate dehydratase [Cyclobacteriaceae bacterium]|nr:NAD(P)H-hydrate dehydratase [Cyclobacteriaceae bacterium]